MSSQYSHIYANPSLNGFVDVQSKVTGRIFWKVKFDIEPELDVWHVFINDDGLVVDGRDDLLTYTSDGKKMGTYKKALSSPISLYKGIIYFFERENGLKSITQKGDVFLENMDVPVYPDCYIPLFEPIDSGMIIHTFLRSPGGQVRQELFVSKYNKLGWFDWISTNEYGDFPPFLLLSIDRKKVISSNIVQKVEIYNVDYVPKDGITGIPTHTFDFPLGEATKFCSCGDDGNLYFCGNTEASILFKKVNLEGTELGQWTSKDSYFPDDVAPIAPPIVTAGRVYLLTKMKLFALEADSCLWEYSAAIHNFTHAVALGDESVLITCGKELLKINKNGKLGFKVNIGKTIITAPAVDEKGIIYLATRNEIISIK